MKRKERQAEGDEMCRRIPHLGAVVVFLVGVAFGASCQAAERVTLPLIKCLELQAPATSITFSPDGRWFLVTVKADDHEHVVRVDAQSWATTELPIDVGGCYPLCLSPDGSLLVYGLRGEVRVVDMAEFKLKLVLPGKPRAYCFSPDGTLLGSVNQTNLMAIWDLRTWREARSFHIPCAYGGVGSLAFALGGNALVAFGKSQVATWALGSRDVARQLAYSGPAALAQLTASSREVALFGYDGILHVVDLSDGREISSFSVGGSLPSRFRLTPCGRFIISTNHSDSSVLIHSVLDGELVATLEGDPVEVLAVAISPQGDFAVSVGQTGRVCVWGTSGLRAYRGSGFEITEVDWRHGSITIANRTRVSRDLLGWTLSDGVESYTFRSSLRIGGGESRIIYPAVFGPSGVAGPLRIDLADAQVSLLAPRFCGSVVGSTWWQ